MYRSMGHEQRLAGLDGDRRLALDDIFDRAAGDVDDLFAGMPVLREGSAWSEAHERLKRLPSADAEVMALKVGPHCSGRPGRRSLRLKRRDCADDEHRQHDHLLRKRAAPSTPPKEISVT